MDDGDDMSFINQALSRTQENGGLFGMPFLRTLGRTRVNPAANPAGSFQSMHDSFDDLSSSDTMSDSNKGSDDADISQDRQSQREHMSPAHAHRILRSYLGGRGAVSAVVYEHRSPDAQANDIWPNVRDQSRAPVQYYRAIPSGSDRLPPATSSNVNYVWPPGKIPTEIYEDIASHLSRDDIKAMRLVCREFDRHVSQVLFKTVVVPFNREIYGMLVDDASLGTKLKEKSHGRANRDPIKSMWWANADREDVYDGHALDVFRRFGPHIVRFGMSFEVDEASLANLPEKHVTQSRTSFWGTYQWPRAEYCRYDGMANIEITADETTRMKQAFSELTRVQELALSLNHGLGWLQGPEKSIRSQIIEQPPRVFGAAHATPDRDTQSRRNFWDYLNACHRSASSDVRMATLYQTRLPEILCRIKDDTGLLDSLGGLSFLSPSIVNSAAQCESPLTKGYAALHLREKKAIGRSQNTTKVMFTSMQTPDDFATRYCGVVPSVMDQAQKEWLMEVGWAQRAFVSSYIISVMDNPDIFANVHTMNIARIPDFLLPSLSRQDFWEALPNLKNIIVIVLPSWRDVTKDKAGFIDMVPLQPSDRLDLFSGFLETISEQTGIKHMTIGWAAGGEHADGLFARNRYILPAPVLPRDFVLEPKPAIVHDNLLKFRHVEELTLVNCWISPITLIELTKAHAHFGLKKLYLKSVSLCGLPKPRNMIGNGGPVFALHTQNHVPGVSAHTQPIQTLISAAVLQQQMQALHSQVQRAQAKPGDQKATWILEFQLEQLRQLQRQPIPPQHPGLSSVMSISQMHAWRFGQNNSPATPPLTSPALPGLAAAPTHGLFGPPQHHPMTAPPPPLIYQGVAQVGLHASPRGGSWVWVLDHISPGHVLSDFGNPFGVGSDSNVGGTKLQCIELESCGYVELQGMVVERYDRGGQDRGAGVPNAARQPPELTEFHDARRAMLQKHMIPTNDNMFGQISYDVDNAESVVLTAGWFMEFGWKDQEASEAVLFDTHVPGGTGRFSGSINSSDREGDVDASGST